MSAGDALAANRTNTVNEGLHLGRRDCCPGPVYPGTRVRFDLICVYCQPDMARSIPIRREPDRKAVRVTHELNFELTSMNTAEVPALSRRSAHP